MFVVPNANWNCTPTLHAKVAWLGHVVWNHVAGDLASRRIAACGSTSAETPSPLLLD